MKRKYQGWGDFLKKRRSDKFRSARDFCARVSVGISYPQYSRYEAGEQLPQLDQALEMCKLLEIPALEGLLEWNRAQLSDSQAKTEIEELLNSWRKCGTAGALGKAEPAYRPKSVVPLDDVIVFNRSHLSLFSSDPLYRDVFTYINSFTPEWITAGEISRALDVPHKKMNEMLDRLSDLGVVLLAGGKCRVSKRNFYFPDDTDFFELRNQNIIHNMSSILKRLNHRDLVARQAFRGLVTRELTSEQLGFIINKIEELINGMVGMPEIECPERIYSFCVLIGERFARPNEKNSEQILAGGI